MLGQDGGRRAAGFAQENLLKQAESFAAALPHQRVTATANGAQYAPDWNVEPDFAGLSFAMYDFSLPDYNLNASLEYSWITDPGAAGNVYVGLGNWDNDRWDWFQPGADERLVLPTLGPYFAFGGGLVVCMLMTGSISGELDWLRIGSLPPQPSLAVSVKFGLTPLGVTFDASYSTDPDGAIAEYRWEPEGDGSFDVSSGTEPQLDWEYAAGGDYAAAVRVIDDAGVFDDAEIMVRAVAEHSFNFGTPDLFEMTTAVVATNDGSLLVLGSIVPTSKSNVLAAKLSPNGSLEFARSWGGIDNDDISDAVLSADGYVYACGVSYTHGGPILQKWTQDGQLVWSKCFVSGSNSRFSALVPYGSGSLYVAGSHSDSTLQGSLARFDTDGNISWWMLVGDATNPCSFADVALNESPVSGLSIRCAGGYTQTDSDAVYTAFDWDGNLTAAKVCTAIGSHDSCDAIVSPFGLTSGIWVVGDSYQSGGGGDAVCFISRVGGGAVTIGEAGLNMWAADLSNSGNQRRDLLWRGDIHPSIVLLTFDASLTMLASEIYGTNGDGCLPSMIASYSSNGFVIAGRTRGLPPAAGAYSPSLIARDMTWSDIVPAVASFSAAAQDTPIETQDVSGIEFNRDATEGDATLIFKRLN